MQTLLSRTATITDAQRAAVAELMAPTENLIGDPAVAVPTSVGGPSYQLLLSPAGPVDDEPADD